MIIAKYTLKKDLPQLKSGAIFEHREYDHDHPDRGNMGSGVLILGWVSGNCQQLWCGETYIFPGQLALCSDWFEKIEDCCKDEILKEIEKLKQKVESL